jgi:ATP adenylyltransferase
MQYITEPKEGDCIFCTKPKQNSDSTNLILYRGASNFIILNAYPYNPGHLMVVLYRHVANLEDLSNSESTEHFELIQRSITLLKKAINPNGFNIGLNIGKVAGAGVEGHLHTHVVPRWQGDVNFMPVLGETRVISEGLKATYEKLKEAFSQ